MKLHWLQHVPFEGLGHIETWAKANDAAISCSRLYDTPRFPNPDAFDLLVVMGGPMGIYDHDDHPWLVAEKAFIRSAIDEGMIVLGICLGAQLIADVLGAKVYPGPHKEIGWFPIRKSENTPEWLPENPTVFHWHGDTFNIPDEAVSLAVSDAGINQGFIYRDRVIGLQFHLETTPVSMEALIENCAHELVDGACIQSAQEMSDGIVNIPAINDILENLLNSLSSSQLES